MKCMKINPAEYKILVVDDVQSNVLLLKALLGREGFGIVYAMNGTEALEKVKSEHPDLILLDVMMPDMDGFEVAGRLKVEPEQAEIPIIFLTALNDSASVVKGFQLGANDFISKPFRREELLIRVPRRCCRHCGRSRLRDRPKCPRWAAGPAAWKWRPPRRRRC